VDVDELEAQTASARGRSKWGGKVLNQRSARGLKGADLTPHLRSRARRVSKTFAHACAPAKQSPTRAVPRFPQNMDLQTLCAVMMERSHRPRRPRCPRP
jgi:hypothetical protein